MSSTLPKHLSAKKASKFPSLREDDYFVTSVHDWAYNCIAHAAGEDHVPWWPMEEETEGVFWPDGVPREETIEAFVAAYKTKDYLPCDDLNTDLEPGFEKVVIYLSAENEPTHAARQLPTGAWTSKLGEWEDIEHKVPLCLKDYGKVGKVLKRRVDQVGGGCQ